MFTSLSCVQPVNTRHTYNQGGCIYHAWPVHTGGEWSPVCQRRLVAKVQCPVICWQMCWLWSMGVSLTCRHEDRWTSFYVRLSLLLVATLHTVKPLRNQRCVCCTFAPTQVMRLSTSCTAIVSVCKIKEDFFGCFDSDGWLNNEIE